MSILNEKVTEDYAAYHADCIQYIKTVPDNSLDFSISSPPFSSLYIYSESEADMGNSSSDEEFFEHYRFLVQELYRAMRPGRLVAIHVKDLVYYQGSSESGTAGLRPFSDDCTKLYMECGFDFHSRITIWRDPVLERSKTNAHGLLWKTFQKDSTFCRVGMPEYLLVFRKWTKEGEEDLVKPVTHPKEGKYATVKPWQELASPVWNYQPGQSGFGDLDLPATDVLNVKIARDDRDEKHLCPMPLNITERAIELYTNEGDVVFSPFMGIGSEGYKALEMGRKFIGTELKEAYFKQAIKHLDMAKKQTQDLFA